MKTLRIKINFLLLFFLLPIISCLFHSLKKLSNDGDYLVVLDKGLYIYNFDDPSINSLKIQGLNATIKSVTISEKYSDNNSDGFKIAVLINQILYICHYDNSNRDDTNCNNIDFKNVVSSNVETFSLILNDMKLRVLFLETTLKSEIKENSVENYLAIRSFL